jgi:hypothetical protein
MRFAVQLIGAAFKVRDSETEERQMWFRRGHSATKMAVEDDPLASERSSAEHLAFTAGRVAQLPRDPDLRLDYAFALLAAQPQQAAVEAQKAAALDKKGDPVLLIRAAMVLVATRDLDPARACAERARLRVERTGEVSPRRTVIVNMLSHVRGQIALLEHDDDLAEQMLGDAYRADPSDECYALDFARLLAMRDRFDEARGIIDCTLARPAGSSRGAQYFRPKLESLRDNIGETERRLKKISRLQAAKSLGPPRVSSAMSTRSGASATSTTVWSRTDGADHRASRQ